MRTEADKNFDVLAERFSRNIYSGKKGRVRLAVVQQQLEKHFPELGHVKGLSILDIGGGIGQVSGHLAEMGHNVTFCEPSSEMRKLASTHFESLSLPARSRIAVHDYRYQTIPEDWFGTFDLILCHAVLEWLGDPMGALRKLPDYCKDRGGLSLLFYNRDSIVLKNLLRGNFRKVKSGAYRGHVNSLTPLNPLDQTEVINTLQSTGLNMLGKAGVRVFTDYLPRQIADARSLEDILELELQFCEREPYASIARYIHVAGRRSAR